MTEYTQTKKNASVEMRLLCAHPAREYVICIPSHSLSSSACLFRSLSECMGLGVQSVFFRSPSASVSPFQSDWRQISGPRIGHSAARETRNSRSGAL